MVQDPVQDSRQTKELIPAENQTEHASLGFSPRKNRRRKNQHIHRLLSYYRALLAGVVVLVLLLAGGMMALGKFDPQVTLDIESGPNQSEETGFYEYIIKANVSGFPRPTVVFTRDDSGGRAGDHKVLIALEKDSQYTLGAIAKNSFGRSAAQLDFVKPTFAEDLIDNDQDLPPGDQIQVTEVHLSAEILHSGFEYILTLEMAGSSGDPIRYSWLIEGPDGAERFYEGNPLIWKVPEQWGSYAVTALVEDSLNGSASMQKMVKVHPALSFSVVPEWSGTLFENVSVVRGNYVFIGDDALNRMTRGYISFYLNEEIPDDFTVDQVELILSDPIVYGSPAVFHRSELGLWIALVSWGERPLEIADWGMIGNPITSTQDYDLVVQSIRWTQDDFLVKIVEEQLKQGNRCFQFKLQFARDTSNENDQMDGVEYDLDQVSLRIKLTLNR